MIEMSSSRVDKQGFLHASIFFKVVHCVNVLVFWKIPSLMGHDRSLKEAEFTGHVQCTSVVVCYDNRVGTL
jgi:hypothetical protein